MELLVIILLLLSMIAITIYDILWLICLEVSDVLAQTLIMQTNITDACVC